MKHGRGKLTKCGVPSAAGSSGGPETQEPQIEIIEGLWDKD